MRLIVIYYIYPLCGGEHMNLSEPFSTIIAELHRTSRSTEAFQKQNTHFHIGANPFLVLWEIENQGDPFRVTQVTWNNAPVAAVSQPGGSTRTGIHQHDYIELMYVVKGRFSQNIAGTDYTFSERDIVFINHGIMHYDYLSENECCVIFLAIPNELFYHLFQNSIHSDCDNFIASTLLKHSDDYSYLHGTPKDVLGGRSSEAERSISELIKEISRTEPGSMHIFKGYLLRLVHYLAREYRFHMQSHTAQELRRLLYEEIANEIRSNCSNITIAQLQEHFYFNRDYFNRLISDFSGYTFRELRQQIRLETAADYLLTTDSTIKDIALSVGYENQAFFYRIFTAAYGMTPRQYRTHFSGNDKSHELDG